MLTRGAEALSSFDLVLKGGRIVDPANGIDYTGDVAVRSGRIAAVGPDIPASRAKRVTNVADWVVLPGLIDTHCHVYEYVSGEFGLNPDDVGIRSGVTTICDQGGAGALTIAGFRKFVVERAKTNVKCFISTYLAGGLEGHLHFNLCAPNAIDVNTIVKQAKLNQDLVRGIKVHVEAGGYSRWGIEVLQLAKQASRATGLPLYVHLGQLWPSVDNKDPDPAGIIDEMVPLLDPGDIIAHPYTHLSAGFVSDDGEVHPLMFNARERGVRLDVGHGNHFSFEAAKAVMKAGIIPDTLGADLHGMSANKKLVNPDKPPSETDNPYVYEPSYSLYTAMSEMLAIGIPESHVFKMVTSNAAKMLGMENEIGSLEVGRVADISVLRVSKGKFTLQDLSGVEVAADTRYAPVFCVKGGEVMDVTSPLLPQWEKSQAA